jgi:hypothetical protein
VIHITKISNETIKEITQGFIDTDLSLTAYSRTVHYNYNTVRNYIEQCEFIDKPLWKKAKVKLDYKKDRTKYAKRLCVTKLTQLGKNEMTKTELKNWALENIEDVLSVGEIIKIAEKQGIKVIGG